MPEMGTTLSQSVVRLSIEGLEERGEPASESSGVVRDEGTAERVMGFENHCGGNYVSDEKARIKEERRTNGMLEGLGGCHSFRGVDG